MPTTRSISSSSPPIPKTQTAGAPFGIEVEARNLDGMVITVFGGTCNLEVVGEDVGDSLAYTPKILDGFSEGRWIGDVTVNGLLEDVVLMVSDGAGHVGVSNAIDVVAGPAAAFVWNAITSPEIREPAFSGDTPGGGCERLPREQFRGDGRSGGEGGTHRRGCRAWAGEAIRVRFPSTRTGKTRGPRSCIERMKSEGR